MFLEGPAVTLYQQSYFDLMRTALKPNGIVCSQGGTAWDSLNTVLQTIEHCRKVFPIVNYATVSVPTYTTGQIGFVLGSLNQVNITDCQLVLFFISKSLQILLFYLIT